MSNKQPGLSYNEEQINNLTASLNNAWRRLDELNRKIGKSRETPNLSDVSERNELYDKIDALQRKLDNLKGG